MDETMNQSVEMTGEDDFFFDPEDFPEAEGGNQTDEAAEETVEGEAKRDDENYFYVGCWEYQGDDEKAPVLYKEPLVYEAIKVQTRNYKS